MQTERLRNDEEERDGPGNGGKTARDPDPTARPADRETETFEELLRIAHRRSGAIPAELVVKKVMAATRTGDWPLRRAALEALLRRFTFARRDELVVSRQPRGKGVLGRSNRGSVPLRDLRA